MRTVPGVTVYGDFSTWERAPVVSLNIGDYESSEVADELAETYDIATRAGCPLRPAVHRRSAPRNRARCASASAFTIRNRRPTRLSAPYRSLQQHERKEDLARCDLLHDERRQAAEKACLAAAVPGRIIPVPRQITSDCGLGWRTPPETRPQVEALFTSLDLEVEGYHLCEL